MTPALRSVQILGAHLVEPSVDQFNETVEIQWGQGLSGEKLQQAKDCVREHYGGLYLIEVQLDPPNAEVKWGEFAQKKEGKPETEWEVAYDERAIDKTKGRWAFFLHYVDFRNLLETPAGAQQLPAPSPRPAHLSNVDYWVP